MNKLYIQLNQFYSYQFSNISSISSRIKSLYSRIEYYQTQYESTNILYNSPQQIRNHFVRQFKQGKNHHNLYIQLIRMKNLNQNNKLNRKACKNTQQLTEKTWKNSINDKDDCNFINFPCSLKSKDNIETLENQHTSQSYIELTPHKNMTLKYKSQLKTKESKLNIQHLSKDNQVQRKTTSKKIQLSITGRNTEANQKISLGHLQSTIKHIKPINNLQLKTVNKAKVVSKTNGYLSPAQIQSGLKCHQSNTLNVDRGRCDLEDIRIAKAKCSETRKPDLPKANFFATDKQNLVYNSDAKALDRTNIIFKSVSSAQHSQKALSKSDYNHNHHRRTQKPSNNPQRQRLDQNKKLFILDPYYQCYSSNQFRQQTAVSNTSNKLNCTDEPFFHSSSNNTNGFNNQRDHFKDVRINDLRNEQNQPPRSSVSTHSGKFKDYMEMQLTQPHTHRILQPVGIGCPSLNQQQNYKTYNTIPNLPQKIGSLEKSKDLGKSMYTSSFVLTQSKLGKNLFSSSFMLPQDKLGKSMFSSSFILTQTKQKQIQNIKQMYMPTNIRSFLLSDNINDNFRNSMGNPQEYEQRYNQYNQTIKQIQNSQSNAKIPIFHQIFTNKLQNQVQESFQTHKLLVQEQSNLKKLYEKVKSQRNKQLQHQISELQTFKYLSMERQKQIDQLRQYLRDRKYLNNFNHIQKQIAVLQI